MSHGVKAAGFREQNTLEDFDWQFNPSIKKKAIFDLATGRSARDVLFLGPPGTVSYCYTSLRSANKGICVGASTFRGPRRRSCAA